MYCSHCGKEIPEKSSVCLACGLQLLNENDEGQQTNKKQNHLSIAALIFSIPPIGLMCGFGWIGFILAVLGMRFAKKNNGLGSGISFAALLLSGFWVFLFLIMLFIGIFMSFTFN